MRVLVIMNRPLLDFDSSRNFFINGLASTTRYPALDMSLVLPSSKVLPTELGVHATTLADSNDGYLKNVLYFQRLFSYCRNFFKRYPNCVVHQFKAAYRGMDAFCLPAISGSLGKHPFIMGPAEVIHEFGQDDYRLYMDSGSSHAKYLLMRQVNENSLVPILGRLFASTVEECDYFVVAYDQAIDNYAKFVPRRKIKTISYGVDLATFRFSPPPNNHTVLFVGNLVERKGVDVLIKTVDQVRKVLPDVKLKIVGNGPQGKRLEVLARKLGMGNNVMFLGRVDSHSIVQEYKECRLFCQPSFSEGFCHVNLEAMASGRPVVCTNTPGSLMITDGLDGYKTNVGDVEMMTDRILKLLLDHELTLKMADSARRKVENDHDWVKISEQYYNLYTSLA